MGHRPRACRFLQFWILPSQEGLESSVQQRQYGKADRQGRLLKIMGPAGEEGLDLAQDARVWVARLGAGDRVGHRLGKGRGGYLYVLDGELRLGEESLAAGDAAKLAGPEELEVIGVEDAELILIEVPLAFRPIGVWAS